MIIFDDIAVWQNPGDAFQSRCRIRIIKLDNAGPVISIKKYYIVASDLGYNTGASITNSAKHLIPWVCNKHGINIDEMVWFENYPSNPSLDVVLSSMLSACCARGCSNIIDIAWRPARSNEIEHLKQFIPDIL